MSKLNSKYKKAINGKVIFVTGGTGSFGKRFIKQFVPDLVDRGCKVIFVTKQFINDFTFKYPASYDFSSVSELVECNQKLTDEFKEKFQRED